MDQVDLINSVANSTDGTVDPSVGLAIAQSSPDITTATTAAQSTQAFQQAQHLLQQYRSQDGNTQRKLWAKATPADQTLLQQVGYVLPKAQHSGILGAIGSTLASAYNAVHTASTVAGRDTVGAAAKALATGTDLAIKLPLRVTHDIGANTTQHPADVTRPAFDGSGAGSLAASAPLPDPTLLRDLTDPAVWRAVFSPHQRAQAYREVKNGEKAFLPEVTTAVKQKYPNDYDVIKALASGSTLDQVVKSVPPDQQSALRTRINTDPDINDGVKLLSSGKMSLGRSIVGSDALYKNPSSARTTSGLLDGVYDWLADPTMHITEGFSGAAEARYAIHSPEDVLRLAQNPRVDQKLAQSAQYIADRNAIAFAEANPTLADHYSALVAADATTAPKFANYIANQVGTANILSGTPSTLTPLINTQIPHLTYAGQAKFALTSAFRDKIDFLADLPAHFQNLAPTDTIEATQQIGGSRFDNLTHPLTNAATATGRAFRSLTTFPAKSLAPLAGDAYLTLQDHLLTLGVPRSNAETISNLFANATSLPDKARIYLGAVRQGYASMGVFANADLAKAAEAELADLESSITQSHWSFGDNATMEDANGLTHEEPLTPQELINQPNWPLPNYRHLAAATKEVSLTRSLFGAINSPAIDGFMEKWRISNLFRPGLGGRLAIEEGANSLLRDGLSQYAQGKAAFAALTEDSPTTVKLLSTLLSHLPNATIAGIEDKSSFIQAITNDYLQRAGYGAMSSDTADAVRILEQNGGLDSSTFTKIKAANGTGAGYADTPATLKAIATDARAAPLTVDNNSALHTYSPVEENFHYHLSHDYNELATNPYYRTVLSNPAMTHADLVNELADKLEADPNWSQSLRSKKLPYGGLFADAPTATIRDLSTNNAERIIAHVDALLTDHAGQEVPTVRDYMLANGRSPSVAALAQIPPANLPRAALGPDLIPINTRKLQGLIEGGMNMFVGVPLDRLVRGPQWLGNYVDAINELKSAGNISAQLAELADNPEARRAAESGLHAVANLTAFDRTIPYIHNPEIRSQFAIVTRNLMPFYYAQEQFFKRWATTFVHSPEAIRKIQLTLAGIQHSGIVHKDPSTGAEYFLYPVTGAVQSVVTHAMDAVGMPSSLPLQPNLRGELKFVTPGTERLGIPSFSPFVAISTNLASNIFPELKQPNQGLLGSQSVGQSFLHQILPTPLARLIDIAQPNFDSAQYSSAMMQAMAQLEATGNGLPENATVKEKDDWLARVKNWTRGFMVTRAVYGFNVPASPENQISPTNLNQQFSRLLADGMTVDQAMTAFIAAHPDARADTIFQSSSESGAPIPSTDAAFTFMQQHSDFLADYPFAAAWFIPTTDQKGAFSDAAYRYSLSEHLRTRKTPTQFYQDIKYAEDAPDYFAAEAKKNQALLAAKNNPGQTALIKTEWTKESQQYLQAHPMFQAGLQGSPTDPLGLAGPQLRTQALSELQTALLDPRLPSSPQTDAIKQLITAYTNYKNYVDQYAGSRTADATRKRAVANSAFAQEVTQFVQANPLAAGVYNKIIRPSISQYLAAIGA